jgi:cytochrome c biogenesis protein CcdA
MKRIAFTVLTFFVFFSWGMVSQVCSQETPTVANVAYVTGMGCGNCAVTDPRLFLEATTANPHLVVFEYEIYHNRKANAPVKDRYFENYLKSNRPGVPFLIIGPEDAHIGRLHVLDASERLLNLSENPFPRPDGTTIMWNDLDLTELPGKVTIWTKNRVLTGGPNGPNTVLKKVLIEEDLSKALSGVDYVEVEPKGVMISRDRVFYEHAVRIGQWVLQWNGEDVEPVVKSKATLSGYQMYGLVLILVFLLIVFSTFRVRKTAKGAPMKFELKGRLRDCMITGLSFCALVLFFVLAKGITPDYLKEVGYAMPLPVFTFFIALVDGFNPCNMFVLTCLLALLVSTSGSRKRLFTVALSFVGMVYIFYFMFMAAWLNIFKYISFIDPLRIAIALLALIAGLINCKELFFFKKGVSLTISEKNKGPLMKRIDAMKDIIQNGSYVWLVGSSIALAAFASLVELPCTAGFPIIYTGILTGRGLESTWGYYAYLALYNLVYVLPLLIIMSIFIYTFRVRRITQRQMEIIKFIGGVIMILLGIVLLVNPGLIGLGMA